MSEKGFKNEHTFDKRVAEAARIMAKYPDRIPVIVEKFPKTELPDIDKKKYLVPKDLTIGQFMYILRKRLKLKNTQAIYIFAQNTLPPQSKFMNEIYKEHHDEDGYLYFMYSGESAFGSDENVASNVDITND